MARISVVINTLNEEKNLPFALRSVKPWAHEIIVGDSYSTDRTVEIAEAFGARVYSFPPTGYADPVRAATIAHATGDWILILDADELVPKGLADHLLRIASEGTADVVAMPRVNYILGAPVLHTGWNPELDTLARFFRRGSLNTTDEVHNYLQPVAGARIERLPYTKPEEALIHFAYTDLASFLEKMNRYTTAEARALKAKGNPGGPAQALHAAVKDFVSRFIKHKGYKDGWRGLYLSLLMAAYRIAAFAKLKEMQESGDRGQVEARYQTEAERVLSAYEAKPPR